MSLLIDNNYSASFFVPENNISVDLISDILSDTEFGYMTRENLGLNIGDQIRLKKKLPEAVNKNIGGSCINNVSVIIDFLVSIVLSSLNNFCLSLFERF